MTGRVTTHDGWGTGADFRCPLRSPPSGFGSWRGRCTWIAALLLVAFSISAATARAADPTDSILAYGCDPPLPRSAANCAIWHTSPVSLRWTLLDPNFTPVAGSSCDTTVVSVDTTGRDVTCAVENLANTRVQKTVTLRVDQTKPTISGATAERAADQTGWWNHAVKWTFAGSDATSGLAGCDTVTYAGPDSATADVQGDCRDVAGNAATGHKTIKYDATAPTISGVTPQRAADQSGWWNHAVKWTVAGSDATSGLAGCDAPTYSGPDATAGTVSGDCRDVAGNSATGRATIKYDATAPTVSGATPERAADHAGWWNHAVKWTFQGSDATSGIASCDAPTYSGPDASSGDVSGACRDNAGNATTGHAAIKYDSTAPTITSATPARPADHNGWWNHPVNVVFSGSDATSGIAGCETVTYSGPDDPAGDAKGACSDGAGNSTSGHATIAYDASAPSITSATPERPPDHDGWWNHPVKVVFAATDATSGLADCDAPTYSGPADAAADVSGDCRDLAGNSATGHLAIKYDAQPPVLSTLPADVGSNQAILHWSTSPDTVLTEITRSPGIGLAPASTVYSGTGQSFADPSVQNDVTYTYSIRASDAAANQAAATVTVTPRADPRPLPDAAPTTAPDAAPIPAPRSSGTTRPLQPPRLDWRRVKGAKYYNVQLYRGRRKILSAWPTSPRLQLRMRWMFHGRQMRLTTGRYDWYVWPGFGRRSLHRYGRLIVHRKFTFNL